MTKTKKILLALSLAALASGSALAATGAEIDADKDGTISADEAAAAGLDITTMEVGDDGVLTVEEYDAIMVPPAQ
ncbi:MAG: hypothetical protein WAN46_06160 [Gammaproteobacteria bacterium]|jgi:hypothetical protein